jgi:BirA family biotin operon repressor/biotin-[acetyl-CoA-carboxylase] ligase
VERIPATGSTNADVLARARAGEAAGLVLLAAHQTAGRGRLDRRWDAPPGVNLLMSVLLRPAGPPDTWHRCLTAMAVAAADACASFGVAARIKWPNDLVVGDDKLAGILAETDGAGAVVVGIGCNIGWPRAGAYPGAASLADHTAGPPPAPDALATAILARLDEDRPDLHAAYRAHGATIGRDVRLELPDGRVAEGHAVDVDARGRLVVESGGARSHYSVADVIHLR